MVQPATAIAGTMAFRWIVDWAGFREKLPEASNGKARKLSPGLPHEAGKEDPAYDPLAGKDPVLCRPAYGADRLDP